MDKTNKSDSKNYQSKHDTILSASRSTSRQGRPSTSIKAKVENNAFSNLINNSTSHNNSKNIDDSITKIFELHQQFNIFIKHLDNKNEKATSYHQSNQEKDYVIAFKYFSNTVQKELDFLKKKTDELTGISLKEDKFKDLEHQLDFYKNEANKYYVASDTNMKVIQDIKRRLKEMEDENEFFKEQIKTSARESKQIKKEYQSLLEEINALKLKNQEYEKEIMNMTIADQSTLAQTNVMKVSKYDLAKTIQETDCTSGSKANSPKRVFGKNNAFVVKMIEDYIERHKTPEKLVDEFTSYIRKCEEAKFTQLEKTKQMLQKEVKENMKLNQYISSTLAEISDYELLFVECVKCIKAEILKRNNNGMTLNQQGDISNIKNFINLDKIHILELFVMTDKVLLAIYELMFPANKFQINELLKPIEEQTKREQDSSDGPCNTSEVIYEKDILRGDKSDFNQSYHFENLMMLKKNKYDLNTMMATTPIVQNKSVLSRRPSIETIASLKLNN